MMRTKDETFGRRRRNGGLTRADYRALAEWRYALRRFLAASERIARSEGVSPAQYQLLLFAAGTPDGSPPAIGDLAERMQVEHQSAVGLVDRTQKAGLVRRRRDPANRRRVLVEVTPKGSRLLGRLASQHFATIEGLGAAFLPPLRHVAAGPAGRRGSHSDRGPRTEDRGLDRR
jgi:DNA-binding MarR family transcriptional regulator